MLGIACFFRSYSHRSNVCSPTLVHSYAYHCVPHPAHVTCRHAAFTSLIRSLSWPHLHVQTNEGECNMQTLSPLRCHNSVCAENRSEVSCATIWHGLVPSHHTSIWEQGTISSSNNAPSFHTQMRSIDSQSSSSKNAENRYHSCGSVSDVLHSGRERNVYGLRFPDASATSSGKFAMASGLLDGSWNVAWDVRPARWLHGRHSAWLSFGVRARLPAATGLSVPLSLSPFSQVKGREEECVDSEISTNNEAIQGKQVFTEYTVTGIPGDGRCLFRAIAYGACLRKGQPAPGETSQQELADELRAKVVDELVSRQADCEWFIEEDFDAYTKRMRECYVWGGEPELLMASHVLRAPIIVHLFRQKSGGIMSIAEYGLEYGTENPIRVLYHGFGHYDAVQVPELGNLSKCNS